jgi:hypothetical protein
MSAEFIPLKLPPSPPLEALLADTRLRRLSFRGRRRHRCCRRCQSFHAAETLAATPPICARTPGVAASTMPHHAPHTRFSLRH